MRNLLGIVVAILSLSGVLHAADTATPKSEPWDKSGSGPGALINGIQSALKGAGLDETTLQKPSGMMDLAVKYNDTYGPYLNSWGMDTSSLMKGDGKIMIRAAFVIAIMAAFAALAFKANKGQAAVTELGFGMAKMVLAVFFVLFPGAVYAFCVFLPLAVTTLFAKQSSSTTAGSTYVVRVAKAANDGVAGAGATLDGAMSAVGNQSANIEQIDALAKALNDFATASGKPADALITLPPRKPDGGIDTTTLESDVVRVLQQFHTLRVSLTSDWSSWKTKNSNSGDPVAKITDLNVSALKALTEYEISDEFLIERLDIVTKNAWDIAEKTFLYEVLLPASGGNLKKATALLAEGRTNAPPFIKAHIEKDSLPQKVVTAISNAVLRVVMPIGARIWLFLIELTMLNLIFMAVFWIHPRTEATAVKSFGYVAWVTIYMPIYLFIYILIDRLLGAFAGQTGGIIGAVTWALRATIASFYAVLAPLMAVFGTVVAIKTIKSGGTMLGASMKGLMTTAGMATAIATPGLRVAAIGASRMMSSLGAKAGGAADASGAAAATADEQAKQEHATRPFSMRSIGSGLKADGLKALSRTMRTASRGMNSAGKLTDYAQEAVGHAFGADDKYINNQQTAEQRRAGVVAAMGAATGHSMRAAVTGGSASSIFEGVSEKGREREYRSKLETAAGKQETVQEAVAAMRDVARLLTNAYHQNTLPGQQLPAAQVPAISAVAPAQAAAATAVSTTPATTVPQVEVPPSPAVAQTYASMRKAAEAAGTSGTAATSEIPAAPAVVARQSNPANN